MSQERKCALSFLAAIIILAGCSSATPDLTGQPGVGQIACTGSTASPGLDAEQTGNARIITAVAFSLGLGEQGAAVGVTAALTESSLRNVNHGDTLGPDSIGLFQQRNPWGALAQRTDPAGAALLFYTVNKGPGVVGLIHIPNWRAMTIPQAAQQVEGSQFSDGSNYASSVPVAMAAINVITPTCRARITGGVAPHPALNGLTPNASQNPADYGWAYPPVLVDYSWNGRSFGQVAAGTEPLWDGLLGELVPLIPGGLNSNAGCYDDRNNVNSPGRKSLHAYGLACDFNTDANPNGVDPHGLFGELVIPLTASGIARKWGMEWGGDWVGSTPDPMHFEIHVTPTQIANATRST